MKYSYKIKISTVCSANEQTIIVRLQHPPIPLNGIGDVMTDQIRPGLITRVIAHDILDMAPDFVKWEKL